MLVPLGFDDIGRQAKRDFLVASGGTTTGGERPPFGFYKCGFVGYGTLSSSTRTYIVKHQKNWVYLHPPTDPGFPQLHLFSNSIPDSTLRSPTPAFKKESRGDPSDDSLSLPGIHPNVTTEILAEMLTAIVSGGSAPSSFACTFRVDDDIGR